MAGIFIELFIDVMPGDVAVLACKVAVNGHEVENDYFSHFFFSRFRFADPNRN